MTETFDLNLCMFNRKLMNVSGEVVNKNKLFHNNSLDRKDKVLCYTLSKILIMIFDIMV